MHGGVLLYPETISLALWSSLWLLVVRFLIWLVQTEMEGPAGNISKQSCKLSILFHPMPAVRSSLGRAPGRVTGWVAVSRQHRSAKSYCVWSHLLASHAHLPGPLAEPFTGILAQGRRGSQSSQNHSVFVSSHPAKRWDLCCWRLHAAPAVQSPHLLSRVWNHGGWNHDPQR